MRGATWARAANAGRTISESAKTLRKIIRQLPFVGEQTAEHPRVFFVQLNALSEQIGGGFVLSFFGRRIKFTRGTHDGFLSEHELANPGAARSNYDRIPVDFPKSGMRDDARWHAARLSRALGDQQGAADRLRALLATREVARGTGSYFSVWLDNAQLELGLVLRDGLADLPGAIAAFERLPKHYPASILKDDALFELAVTHTRAGARDKACAAFAKLVAQSPESKYIARKVELGCP